MLTAGTQLGPYKILGLLGAGGMGEVYRALDARLGREVALKILPPRFADDPDRLVRFEREARAVAALAHPNIVVVHDFGTDHGVTFTVSELLEGESLQDRLGKGPLPWRKAVELAIAIADGLAAAHGKGIVHRDLKPANVFVTSDERIKILDFGLAKLLAEDAKVEPVETQTYRPALTETGVVVGTAPYMSPEQLRGQSVDARSDIFSFGCMLYEMVAGKRPFTGDTRADFTAAILQNDPPELTDSGKKVPVELERLIRRCLEKNPEARFQSARDLAFALRGIATGSLEVQPAQSLSRPRFHGWLAAGVVLTAVVLSIVFWPRNPVLDPANVEKSTSSGAIEVAVLPFINNIKNVEDDYLSDGLPGDIIKSLSAVGKLKVRPFSTVSRLHDPHLNLEETGRILKVQAVLTGKIVTRKDGFTLSVELVNVGDDSVLWSERYDSTAIDIQTVQMKIARQICAKLKVTMTADEEKKLGKRYTENAEAYQLYLQGRHHYFKETRQGRMKAAECFRQAIEKDPNYALAYAGFAEAYGAGGLMAPNEAVIQRRKAAKKALELDEHVAEAHTALGGIHLLHDWDWPGAEKEFKRALVLDPSSIEGYNGYYFLLVYLERFKEAEKVIKKAVQVDPLTPWININVAHLHYCNRKFDQTIQVCQEVLGVDPSFMDAHNKLGMAHVQKKQYPQALTAFKNARQLDNSYGNRSNVAYAHALLGDTAAARLLLDELIAAVAEGRYVNAAYPALIHLGLGDKDQACEWLEKAYDQHSHWMLRLKVDPLFDPLRSEPRFVELVKKMKFP